MEEKVVFEKNVKKLGSYYFIIIIICYYLKGSGGFGDVYLTKNKKLQKLYALKCISKCKIVEQELE